ncbi:hypothetical protein ACOSQ2_020860 [Xanthoceras sorbifolium]
MCSRRRYYWAGNGDFTMITAAFAMKINTSISVDISRPRPKSFKVGWGSTVSYFQQRLACEARMKMLLWILMVLTVGLGMVICPFMVELDSAGVVNIVRSRISALSGVGLFTDRIIDKLEIPSFNSLVPRSANMAA